MACPKCGCRLLSKVGRSRTLLICTDCGHPHQPASKDDLFHWHQLSTMLLLGALAAVALALSLLSDSLSPGDIPREEPSHLDRSNKAPALDQLATEVISRPGDAPASA